MKCERETGNYHATYSIIYIKGSSVNKHHDNFVHILLLLRSNATTCLTLCIIYSYQPVVEVTRKMKRRIMRMMLTEKMRYVWVASESN